MGIGKEKKEDFFELKQEAKFSNLKVQKTLNIQRGEREKEIYF